MKRIAIGIAASLVIAGAAAAQTSAPKTDLTGKPGTLSEKLNQSGGVIHPQDSVDPGMQKAAPSTGSMPVIPPPGSPGGSPNVQPK